MALAEGRVGMARAGEIGLTIGMIAVWLADRLHAPELHTERQVKLKNSISRSWWHTSRCAIGLGRAIRDQRPLAITCKSNPA